MKAALALAPDPLPSIDPYSLVTRRLLGHDHGRIARAFGVDVDVVAAVLGTVDGLVEQVEAAVRTRFLAEGDADAQQLAKAKAPEAMRTLIGLSDVCGDPKTRRAASRDILEFAGVVPAKKIEVSSGDKLLDQMTVIELQQFARGEWPERFRDQLRRIQVRKQLETGVIDVTPLPPVAERDEG